jgi:hypothetical protein
MNLKLPVLFIVSVLFVSVFVQSSCNQPEKKPTKEEVEAFGKKIEKLAAARDLAALNEVFDKKGFLKKLELPSGTSAEGFKQGLSSKLNFGTLIFQNSKDLTYQFLHQYEKNNKEQHAIFRFYAPGVGLNYHDCVIELVKGQCKIANMYLYTTGENYDETLRNMFFEAGLDEEASKKILTMREDDITRLQRMRYFMQQKQFAEAKQEFEAMSLSAQQMRLMQLQNISICTNISNEEHLKAISNFKRLYPDDKKMGLVLLDGYFINEEYEQALECVNQLDSSVLGDPFLNYYRFNIYTRMNESNKAQTALETVVLKVKNFQPGFYSLIDLYLSQKEFVKADVLVKKYRASRKFNQQELDELLKFYPLYKEKAEVKAN